MESGLSLIHLNEEDLLTPLRCINIHSSDAEKPTKKRGCAVLCAIRTVKWFQILSLFCYFDFWFCGIFQTRLNAMQMKFGDNEETNMKQKCLRSTDLFSYFFHFRKQYLSEYSEWSLCCIAISVPYGWMCKNTFF